MGGLTRKSIYKKRCRKCGKDYTTTHKYSQICNNCKKEKGKEKLGGINSSKSYWRRFLDGEI